jgi:hypothetical protein
VVRIEINKDGLLDTDIYAVDDVDYCSVYFFILCVSQAVAWETNLVFLWFIVAY